MNREIRKIEPDEANSLIGAEGRTAWKAFRQSPSTSIVAVETQSVGSLSMRRVPSECGDALDRDDIVFEGRYLL